MKCTNGKSLHLFLTALTVAGLLSLPFLSAIASLPSAQGSQPVRKEISRKRAIQIARRQVSFKPKSVDAIKMIEDKRKVWRVTFRGEPISKVHSMGETTMVSVDRLTGEIVSISTS